MYGDNVILLTGINVLYSLWFEVQAAILHWMKDMLPYSCKMYLNPNFSNFVSSILRSSRISHLQKGDIWNINTETTEKNDQTHA